MGESGTSGINLDTIVSATWMTVHWIYAEARTAFPFALSRLVMLLNLLVKLNICRSPWGLQEREEGDVVAVLDVVSTGLSFLSPDE